MKKAFLLAMAVLFLIPGLALADDWGVYPGAQVFSSDTQDGHGGYVNVRWLGDLSKNWQLGAFALGAMGGGESDSSGYEYDYRQFSLGPQVRYRSDNYWDVDFSIGPWFFNNKGELGNFSNSQDDVGLYVASSANIYQRRHWKREWFPETKVFVSAVASSAEYEQRINGQVVAGGEAYENSQFSARVTELIYDVWLGSQRRISPLVLGEVSVRDGNAYWGLGAGLEFQLAPGMKISLIGKYREDPDTADDRTIGMIAGSFEF